MNNDQDLEKYRHMASSKNQSKKISTRNVLGVIFGIFMFLVYEGMGVLMFINFFNWSGDWEWTRWIIGVVLVIYGFFRAYRTYKDLTRNDFEDEA